MEDSDKENHLDVLVKRRNQLATLAKYHRKMFRRSMDSQTNFPGQSQHVNSLQSTEIIPEVKTTHPTTPENVSIIPGETRVQSRTSNSTDIIEDSEDENIHRSDRPSLTIYSSSEDDITTSTILFPRPRTYFGNIEHQTHLPIENPSGTSNPNKKICILLDIILKDSSITELSTYSEAHEHEQIDTSRVSSSPCRATAPSDAKETSTSETRKDNSKSTTHISLQQSSSSPTAATASDAKETSSSETRKDNSESTTYISLQQSSSSPTATTPSDGKETSSSETRKDNSGATAYVSLQQSSSSPPAAGPSGVKRATKPKTCEDISDSDVSNMSVSLLEDRTVEAAVDIILGPEIHEGPSNDALIQAEIVTITQSTSNDDTSKISRKRMRRKAAKKSFIDFLSDEEKQDFSSGSSDNWSYKESNSNSEEEHGVTKRKKKRVKKCVNKETSHQEIKKKEKPFNKRKISKSLKDAGKAYENRSAKSVPAKTVQPNPCVPGKCTRGYFDISEERRSSLHKHFWSLDTQRRRDWIVHCAQLVPIKRRKKDRQGNRRNATYQYLINDGEGHKQVCQKFLLDTLAISQKYMMYTISHATEGMAQKDNRTPNAPQKYTEAVKSYVSSFIEKLPAVPSHYNRKRTNRTYLPQELKSVSNLYQIYVEDCTEKRQENVSETVFRSIFREYNISFHIPKKDKCVTCVKAENNKETTTDGDKEAMNAHVAEKDATKLRFEFHQNLKTPNNGTIVCSFDLQKVLNTPHGESMLLYYSRKYAVYNLTFYESGTQNVYCYTWGECDGKRGSNEIGTCLVKYLEEMDKQDTKHLILYCDSCSGQNKNKTVLAVINHFLKSAINLEVIQINYLLPGHTYMPVDSVHAVIEREVNKLIVWAPSQWATYFESARKRPRPYKVNVMDHTDFLNFDQLAANTFTAPTLKNVKFKQIRIATFKSKHPDQIYVKYSMKQEAISHTVILCEKISEKRKERKGKGQSKGKKGKPTNNKETDGANIIKPLYSSRLKISSAKYKDLIRLCNNGSIPRRFHEEYRTLPFDSVVRDALNETDNEEDESEA